jgi:quercetin dioxygenase-like cupin family protein
MIAASDLRTHNARQEFQLEGFLGNIPFLTPSECALLARHLFHEPPPPLDWHKGRAATDRLIYDIAVRKPVVELVKSLLGDNVILWGAVIVEQSPQVAHAWHTDIETSAADARCASIWVGLENTSPESTLELVSRSHRVGKPVQQAAVQHGLRRDDVSREQALAWAREHDPSAQLVRPVVDTGRALVFDGRIWHSSFNDTPSAKRTALLLQYAAADVPIRIPDFTQLEWPFRFKTTPRPPVLVVSGEVNSDVNRVVVPPSYSHATSRAATHDRALTSHVRALAWPLAEDPKARWKAYPVTRGRTRTVGSMSAHVSVLSPGHSPHPPHVHTEEEILIVLDGEAELIVDEGGPDRLHTKRIEAGSFVYYPSFVRHTIRNPSTRPVTYLMFKWVAPSLGTENPLPWSVHEFARAMQQRSDRPFATTTVFEGATSFLSLLHAHTSVAQPRGGYSAHVDGHDVAIVLHSGRVETLGQVIEGPAVIYYSAGESHGLRNVGSEPARYLVFEFHSQERADLDEPIPTGPPMNLRSGARWGMNAVRNGVRRAYRVGRRVLGRKQGLLSHVMTLRDHWRRN